MIQDYYASGNPNLKVNTSDGKTLMEIHREGPSEGGCPRQFIERKGVCHTNREDTEEVGPTAIKIERARRGEDRRQYREER